MARFLLISNGHGEDLSAAQIGKELKKRNHEVNAFPLVGMGNAYLHARIKVVTKTKEFTTGGLGYTSLAGRVTELFQGQLIYLLRRILCLFRIARSYDLLVVVGDVVPVLSAWITGVPGVIYLVAYSSHYEGRLTLPWPCAFCLSSKKFLRIFSRDQLTAYDLTNQLQKKVIFLGNPFMDSVLSPQSKLPHCRGRLGLLPGSRRPELDSNLQLMLSVMSLLKDTQLSVKDISFDIALVSSLDSDSLQALAQKTGWYFRRLNDQHLFCQLVKGEILINVHRQSFSQVLQSSDVLFCMAGTAAEQAMGLAKPVVQLQGYGPQFTKAFAEAQRRLLGPTIFCADGQPGTNNNLFHTACLLVDVLEKSLNDVTFKNDCIKESQKRAGAQGGTTPIVNQIEKLIDEK